MYQGRIIALGEYWQFYAHLHVGTDDSFCYSRAGQRSSSYIYQLPYD